MHPPNPRLTKNQTILKTTHKHAKQNTQVGYIPPGKKQVVYRGESGLRSSAAAPDPQVSARPARTVDVSGAALDAYYPAHCQQCSTQVAVLNMTDEVYHFFDCLESA